MTGSSSAPFTPHMLLAPPSGRATDHGSHAMFLVSIRNLCSRGPTRSPSCTIVDLPVPSVRVAASQPRLSLGSNRLCWSYSCVSSEAARVRRGPWAAGPVPPRHRVAGGVESGWRRGLQTGTEHIAGLPLFCAGAWGSLLSPNLLWTLQNVPSLICK